jgi:hypothetical protein
MRQPREATLEPLVDLDDAGERPVPDTGRERRADLAPCRAAVGAEKALLQPELVYLAGQETAAMPRKRFQVVRIGHGPKCGAQQLLFSVAEQPAESRVDMQESI